MSCLMLNEDAVAGLMPTEPNGFSIGTAITLATNDSIPFTVPSDGYLTVYSANSDTYVYVTITVGSNTATIISAEKQGTYWPSVSIYLRKGMQVTINSTGSHGGYRFNSIV